MDIEAAWRTVLDEQSTNEESREAALNVLVWLANGGVGVLANDRSKVTRLCEIAILGEFDRLDR